MAGLMVIWGLSEILIWWQIKSTRRVGAALMILSLIAAAGVGMHEILSVSRQNSRAG
jgi:hypothetical protein